MKILGELAARFAAINADIAAGVPEHDIVELVEISISSIINSLLFGFRFDEVHIVRPEKFLGKFLLFEKYF